jgi:hypothetical protein
MSGQAVVHHSHTASLVPRCHGPALIRRPTGLGVQEVWQQARTEAPDLWDESLAKLDDGYKSNWLGPA